MKPPALGSPIPVRFSASQVRQIAGNIYEYDWIVPTGADRYHSISVHRVVQVVNGEPTASHNAVLLAHGDKGNFNAGFMAGTHSPQSLPVYLASHAIDVWGIDYGWALVPAGETNCLLMRLGIPAPNPEQQRRRGWHGKLDCPRTSGVGPPIRSGRAGSTPTAPKTGICARVDLRQRLTPANGPYYNIRLGTRPCLLQQI